LSQLEEQEKCEDRAFHQPDVPKTVECKAARLNATAQNHNGGVIMTNTYKTAPTVFSTTGGNSFAYRELGRKGGVPVILLTHLTANLDDWDPAIVDGLAEDHHVIAFDNRGVGASGDKTPTSIEEMAQDAETFIDSLGFQQVDLLGFSMGGFIAPLIAKKRPGLVRRMVLSGTSAFGGEGISNVQTVFQNALQEAAERKNHPKHYLFFSPSPMSQAAADAFLQRLGERTEDRDTPTSAETIHAQMAAIVKWGNTPYDKSFYLSINQPTLITNGDADVMVPTINSITLFQGLPNARLSIFPDAGHGGIFQYHEEFLKQLRQFLNQ
jgi:pimeloyl-ACP methyl ester carboxylesterase